MCFLYFIQQALTNAQGAASDSETLDEQRTGKLSPRVSVSGEGEEPSSGPTTPKRKFSKFALSQFKFISVKDKDNWLISFKVLGRKVEQEQDPIMRMTKVTMKVRRKVNHPRLPIRFAPSQKCHLKLLAKQL